MHPLTLGELRMDGHVRETIKQELRRNLLADLASRSTSFSSIVGYSETVLPSLERGILAGHDMIFLGERGQAKTRLIRHLADLLDEQVPRIAGCEINDHPYEPICMRCKQLVDEKGDSTPVDWMGRDERFSDPLGGRQGAHSPLSTNPTGFGILATGKDLVEWSS